MVKTKFNRERVFTPSGTKYLNTYQEEINKKGVISLVKTGETNIYERIQQDLEGTKIENILHQVAMGDLSVLNQRDALYVDATTMPKNLMEAQNIVIKAKAEFEKLPQEVREIFHNSADEYVNTMGTQEFLDKMKPYNEKIAKIAEEENYSEYLRKVKEGAKLNYDIRIEEENLKNLKGGEN